MIGIISYQRSPGRCRDRPGQILPSRFSPNSAQLQIRTTQIQIQIQTQIQILGGAETGREKYYQAASLPTLQDHKYTQYTYKEKGITYTYKKFLSEKLFFSCTGALSALWRTKSALAMFGGWQLAGLEFV